MNWLVLLIAFSVGAAVGVAAVRRFKRTAGGWSGLRRVLTAAALVPAAITICVVLGVAWAYLTLPEGGEGGRDIASFVFAVVGAVLGVPALLGGLVGATVAERSKR